MLVLAMLVGFVEAEAEEDMVAPVFPPPVPMLGVFGPEVLPLREDIVADMPGLEESSRPSARVPVMCEG